MPFTPPSLDYHALAPEIILTVVLAIVLVADLFLDTSRKWLLSNIAAFGLVAAMVPILSLALSGDDVRSMVGGAYVVDNFALVLKALFLGTGFVVLLMSINYVEDGDYYEGEFYFLLLCSLLGMVVMSSSRDLITIFVALETLSIPAYMLAGWRKRDLKSNEASLKYYLLGVLASAVMLYGMSLIYGFTGTTVLADIGEQMNGSAAEQPLVTMAIVFIIVGFAFKVSAVPFHSWAPDTYEGAPTPVTAFLSVASKTGGFVALLQLIFVGFFGRDDVWGPMFGILAALTMTVGNLIALRQTNIVRMLAYSSIAQAGYILVPFAIAGSNEGAAAQSAFTASVVYLLVYAAMNLGVFAIVIAVARKTRSGEITSYGGLYEYAPGLAVLMTIFLFSLAGIPPLAGLWAKLFIFRAVLDAGTAWALLLGVVAAVNSVIALFYYAAVAREMWMSPVPDGDRTPIRVPAPLITALGITAAVVVVVGVYPQAFANFGDLASLVP
ncbi:MAG: NADH-ubiquinone oxidoreductase chain N [uncultured Acidimicrobiales bacterium]|uniref:NADH-quinone oxidoreductase subunit N n=1 Tax=uncultured Acidimicrobiales bacterium TaxID=310071 RepID=A0A6J4JGV3_9ACTN|nr:MAG: NADH-ubiquinone oxidoreductase chain N [uncultured Acidimicrobiales bacterium]